MDSSANCPWYGLEEPALRFCEESLCAWIKTPANSWSSLAFTLCGIYILWRELKKQDHYLIGYGPMAILIGLLSFAYHASLTRYGEIGDLSSMFLMGSFYMVKNFERMNFIPTKFGRVTFWILNIICTLLLFWFKDLGAPLFFVFCMTALGLELKLKSIGRGVESYRYFVMAFFVWLAAQAAWLLDITHTVCEPSNHILQGHALWHILMAVVCYLIYLHYDLVRKVHK